MSGTEPLFSLDRVLDEILGDEETARLNNLLTDLSEALDRAGARLEEVVGDLADAAQEAGLEVEELLEEARAAARDIRDRDKDDDDGGNGHGDSGDGDGAAAAGQTVFAILLPENNSGALGFAAATLSGNTLDVQAVVDNVAPGVAHPLHIHGFADGRTERPATIADDADGDGHVETAEGAAAIGPVLASLTASGQVDPTLGGSADFPVASAAGRVVLTQSYQLDPGEADDAAILAALQERLAGRFIQMHGAEIPEGAGEGTTGEVNGTGGYAAILPVAAGRFLTLPADVAQGFAADPAALLEGITAFLGALAPFTLKADGSGPIAPDPFLGADDGPDENGEPGDGDDASGPPGDDGADGADGHDAGGADRYDDGVDDDAGEDGDDANGDDGADGDGDGDGAAGDGAAERFVSLLLPSNHSAVFGAAMIEFDGMAGTVAVDLDLRGLEPGMEHAIHIHGFADDRASLLPNLTLDADLDGFVEEAEAASVIGPVRRGLTADGSISDAALAAQYPVADANGFLSLEQTYSFDLDDPAEAAIFAELQDRMEGRQLQVHGLALPADQGEGTRGEVEGEAGYQPLLAVANGAILSADDAGGAFGATLGALVQASIEAQVEAAADAMAPAAMAPLGQPDPTLIA